MPLGLRLCLTKSELCAQQNPEDTRMETHEGFVLRQCEYRVIEEPLVFLRLLREFEGTLLVLAFHKALGFHRHQDWLALPEDKLLMPERDQGTHTSLFPLVIRVSS